MVPTFLNSIPKFSKLKTVFLYFLFQKFFFSFTALGGGEGFHITASKTANCLFQNCHYVFSSRLMFCPTHSDTIRFEIRRVQNSWKKK